MKRNPSLTLTLLALLALAFGACTSRRGDKAETPAERQRMEGEAEVNPMVEQLDQEPDAAFRATLVEQRDDSLVLRNTETGQTLVLGYIEAEMGGQMKGSLTKGNEYSIFPAMATKSVTMAINVSELRGQWFYDMQQHRGMRFEPHGAISSINPKDISFREWKLLNGRLYIYYLTLDMVAPDRNEYLVQPAEIISLSKDRLQLEFLGKAYNCQRQQKAIKMKF